MFSCFPANGGMFAEFVRMRPSMHVLVRPPARPFRTNDNFAYMFMLFCFQTCRMLFTALWEGFDCRTASISEQQTAKPSQTDALCLLTPS